MFTSLNKKLIYTIGSFFLFTSLIFVYSFYFTYGIRLQEELKSNIERNQQFVGLLYENHTLKKELKVAASEKGNDAIERQISKERERIASLQKSYNDRYLSIYQGIKFVGISSILFIAAVILMWFLIRRWVIVPIEKLTAVNLEIAKGKLSARVKRDKLTKFPDEIDFLTDTFNFMLDKLESNVLELKEAQDFLQKIIDGIPDGLRVINENYDIIVANKEYYKMVESHKKKLKCYEASFHKDVPCNHNLVSCPLYEICQNKKKKLHMIQQFASKPNNHLYINAAAIKIKDKKYIIEIMRDLSGDIEFSHQQKISSLNFLSSSIAHEMKNHLGSIRIIIEYLEDKYKDKEEETDKLLQLINKEIVESLKVPERLLALSQIPQDQMTEINCTQNIKDIIDLMDYEAKIKGMNIYLKSPQDVKIYANATDFKMIIINLVLNAIHAGKPDGKIEISLSQNKENALIKVSDDGIGIAPEILGHIFEPLFTSKINGQIKGNGLGLAIVKSIVDKFNGQIDVKSKLGKGTTFSIRFPLHK